MSEPGTIAWVDLTVANAENLRDFYTAVVGWECEALEVGDYSDFVMRPAGGGGPASPAASAGSQAEPQPSSSLRATRFWKRPSTYDAAPRPLAGPCIASAALPSSRIRLG
mgnify:CR=1 FL=1